MATSGEAIRHLWTHKTQDHAWLADEELVIERAEGVWVWTERGKKLLDGFAGLAVVNVGHGRREIAEAIAEQTVRLAYYPTTRQFSNRPAAELAAKLATLTPGDLDYTLFATSGSEANERAMQIARHYWIARGKPDKHKVISLQGGYHGATMGTFAVCGLPHMTAAYSALQPAGFTKVAPPYPFRDRGAGTDEQLVQRRARELSDAIVKEGADTVSAVIMEPVLSSGGFIIPPLGWLRAVREICDELGVLMIADEVITGFGRTGKWFGVDHEGVVPDLMTVAKGITSGYLPLSGTIARGRLADAFPETSTQEVVHPNTYAAHPVACAAALANLQIMEKDGLGAHDVRVGREAVLFHDVQICERRRARHRVRRIRVGMDDLLCARLGKGVGQPAARDRARERQVPRRDALGDGHEIGNDALVVDAEPAARAPEAGDDLVGDHQHVQLVADRAHGGQPAQRRDDEAARRQHRLHDDRRDGVGALREDRVPQFARAAPDELLVRPRAAIAERVRRRDFREACRLQRRVRGRHVRQPAHRERAHGRAVIAALQRDDLVLAGLAARDPVVPRDLHRPFVGLRAARGEQRVVEITRRQRRQLRGQLGGRSVGELARRGVIREAHRLLGDGLGDLAAPVAHVDHGEAGK